MQEHLLVYFNRLWPRKVLVMMSVAFLWSCNLINIAASYLNFSVAKIIFILFSNLAVLNVRFAFYVLDVHRLRTQMYSMEDMTVRESCLIEVENVTNLLMENFMMNKFSGLFDLINFQLSAKHFSVLPWYSM